MGSETQSSRSQPPEVDEFGNRPGHPTERLAVTAGVAAARLRTSTTTVRKLVERDEIEGYWQLKTQRYRYFVYQHAIDDFLNQYGHFPEAAARNRSSRPRVTVPSKAGTDVAPVQQEILQALRDQRAVLDAVAERATTSQARILTLEYAVRNLVDANSHLRSALRYELEAARAAEEAQSLRAKAIAEVAAAGDSEADIVLTLPTPDFPPR